MPEISPRSEYLLGGRRVKLADLLSAGLLEEGADLRFDRPRRGAVHRAKVLASGALELDDGRRFASPSRAAAIAADARAFDGWHAWVVEANGKSLDALRQELLDRVSQDADGPAHVVDLTTTPEDGLQPRSRHEWLKEMRAKAEVGQPVSLPVRELLSRWNAQGRGQRISSRIETELANHGLSTSPDFRRVTLDARVAVLPELTSETTESPQAPGLTESLPRLAGSAVDEAVDGDSEPIVVGLAVSNLPSATAGVAYVTPQSTLSEAITVMLLNDYSQIAVMSGPRKLQGAVSWKSIAQARQVTAEANLEDATVRASEFRADEDLIDILPTLATDEFVFVRDSTNLVSGIVTTTDVVTAYDQLARPFFLIGELDQLLRRLISQTYSFGDVQSLLSSGSATAATGFDDLSIGDYQRILENPDCWAQLEWPLDRAAFVARLDELREVRNDVMHFNPDPISPTATARLRLLIRLIRMYE